MDVLGSATTDLTLEHCINPIPIYRYLCLLAEYIVDELLRWSILLAHIS